MHFKGGIWGLSENNLQAALFGLKNQQIRSSRSMKKKLTVSGRQFHQIMSNTQDPQLGFHLLQTSSMNSAKAQIVFEMAKDGLHFR